MPTKAVTRTSQIPSLFDEFFKPWSAWFDNGFLPTGTLSVPAVNVTEDKNQYTVSLAAPGLKKDDFKIELDGNLLTISSEKEEEKEESKEKYTRREYSYTSFSRSFTLPDDVRQEGIEAVYEDGVLKIRLARKEGSAASTASKTITVR